MKNFLFVFLILVLCAFSVNAQTTRTILWTAKGDDGNVGTASQYDIRYSADSTALINSFIGVTIPPSVIVVANPPIPKVAGSAESYTITGLQTGVKYFVVMRVGDEIPNWSARSNILSFTLLDLTPPDPVTDLR